MNGVIIIALLAVLLCWAAPLLKQLYSYISNGIVWNQLRGEWVLVDGATAPVGRHLCEALVRRGQRVLLANGSEEALQALQSELLLSAARAWPPEHWAPRPTEPAETPPVVVVPPSARGRTDTLKRYVIGLAISLLATGDSQPRAFTSSRASDLIGSAIQEPLRLLQTTLCQMRRQRHGYVVVLGMAFGLRPRPRYALAAAIAGFYRSWAESVYYEMKSAGVNVEYMEIGHLAIDEPARLLVPDVQAVAESVLRMFGNSYFTVPHPAHFVQFLALQLLPRWIVGRWRRLCTGGFEKRARVMHRHAYCGKQAASAR